MENEKKFRKLLPIGSVVALDKVKGRFMIIGHLQKQSDSDSVWDYAAVPFPVGLLDPDKFLLFNHDKIVMISFIGLQDEDSLSYMEELFYVINNIKADDE